MLRFSVSKHLPAELSSAAGTVLGEAHRQKIVSLVSTVERATPTIFLFDYDGVDHVTSSYVKRTALWLFRCGAAYCNPTAGVGIDELASDLGGFAPLPANVFPMVTNLSTDIREEINEVFARRSLPILEAAEINEEAVQVAYVLGQPEISFRDTLTAIAELEGEEATAKALFASRRDAGIGLTAWGNRLGELHRLRVLDRRKQGKEWVYRPIVKAIEYGRKNHF